MTPNPVIAIMYDFDKTLCTKDMQEYTFIPSLDESAESFWKESNRVSKEERMDAILTYMYLMVRKSKDKHLPINRRVFEDAGKNVKLFAGVREWFDRINAYGESRGVTIEHYIISSGLKEIILGSGIGKHFREIYACEFHYDENGVADWPRVAVNYTNKTQFLFRINKGCLDMSDDNGVNEYVEEEKRPVPFRNMIYIGDGMTDVPCMKLVKLNGGSSIAVYQKNSEVGSKLLKAGRVDYIAKADYTEGRELDMLVKRIIDKMSASSDLARIHENMTRKYL